MNIKQIVSTPLGLVALHEDGSLHLGWITPSAIDLAPTVRWEELHDA